MAVLKCKMCGGDLNFEEGATVVECEYCGTKQTVPTIDDEKKITLFGRANRLRFACEFDKASGIYESIVADFPTEAEAYWGLVLCKYGIEYVDDPATGKKIPTCHRSSFESVMEDDNFEQVMENADPIARAVYREEAKQIEELRRGIIEVSNKEEPYDIFICYKETAENGERTIDSVIAQDVYNELTEKGYRVFFSHITLEDKLGQGYEPYIFAALNSAKIMLAFGTDYEYYNAVWVKNEWSRFLQLIARGEKKTLIPCYKNIDAYDIPKEFTKLQPQDMGKAGAIQDLLRTIEKLLPRKESEQTAQVQSGKETIIVQQTAQSAMEDSLLKRAFMYLEDSDWNNAADYCNRVLDISPENAEAYVGLLMAELRVKREEELAGQTESFEQNKHFIKAVRFAGEERRKALEGYSKVVLDYLTEQQEMERQQEEKRQLEERKQQEKKRQKEKKKVDYQKLEEKRALAKKASCLISPAAVLKTDGTVITSIFLHNINVSNWENIKAVSSGIFHIVGLKSDGTVLAAGDNTNGKCNVADWNDIVAVAASDYHTVGLKSDGTVLATGDNAFGECDVSDWNDIVAVAVSTSHTVGLKSDGTVHAAGSDAFDECDVSGWEDIVAVAVSTSHTVGLKSDGTVVATGDNTEGECNVSDWEDIVAVAAGSFCTVGLKSDGTVVATGDNTNGECKVSNWKNIVAVIIGVNETIGLKSDGTVKETDAEKSFNSIKLFNKLATLEQEFAKGKVTHEQEVTILSQQSLEIYKQLKHLRESNLCQYCGGEFKGLFTKKCSVCGRLKDY